MSSGRALQPEQNERIRSRVRRIVAEKGTQTAAAQALGIARPHLTQHLLGKGAGHVLIDALMRFTGETYEELVQGGGPTGEGTVAPPYNASLTAKLACLLERGTGWEAVARGLGVDEASLLSIAAGEMDPPPGFVGKVDASLRRFLFLDPVLRDRMAGEMRRAPGQGAARQQLELALSDGQLAALLPEFLGLTPPAIAAMADGSRTMPAPVRATIAGLPAELTTLRTRFGIPIGQAQNEAADSDASVDVDSAPLRTAEVPIFKDVVGYLLRKHGSANALGAELGLRAPTIHMVRDQKIPPSRAMLAALLQEWQRIVPFTLSYDPGRVPPMPAGATPDQAVATYVAAMEQRAQDERRNQERLDHAERVMNGEEEAGHASRTAAILLLEGLMTPEVVKSLEALPIPTREEPTVEYWLDRAETLAARRREFKRATSDQGEAPLPREKKG